MSKAWIEELAVGIKEKNRAAANAYGREQHRLGIIDARSPEFFGLLAQALDEDFAEIRAQLQGDVTSTDTSFERKTQDVVMMTRSRFPWFNALLHHDGRTIVLEYAQGLGVGGDTKVASSNERRVKVYSFVVTPDDTMLIEEGFGEDPKRFSEPAELAKQIVETLFALS
jgi:hypothetical protein